MKRKKQIGNLKIKQYLVIIFIILTLTSCSNGEDKKMEIIAYGTPEFDEFVKNAPISLDEAWGLQLKYYEEQNQKVIGSPLFFIIDNKYIFTPYYNAKTLEVKIEGIAIDSKTGETNYINKKIKLEPTSQFGWKKTEQ